MAINRRSGLAVLFALCGVAVESAPQTAAQIPIRSLAPAEARTVTPLGIVAGIRELSGGRLLVNDRYWHRLVVLEKSFARFVVTADTAAGAPAPFPMNRGAGLIQFTGDSTLTIDDASRAFVVLDGAGRPARTMAMPIASHFNAISGPIPSGFDARGRLVYQEPTRMRIGPARASEPPQDSSAILRASFDTRNFDTVAKVRIQSVPPSTLTTDPTGRVTAASMTVNPSGVAVDSWTVTSDGAVAIVRGHDYHIDWIDADGTRRSSAKLPFDWRRLTDAEKQAKVDSAQKIIDASRAAGGYTFQSCPVVSANETINGGTGGRGGGRDTTGAIRADSRCHPVSIKTEFVPLSAMPDYIPPVRPNAAIADRDGNVWILPTTSLQANGGLLYDVVNRKGELFERVQLPPDRAIAGFGPGGVVYLAQRVEGTGVFLERTR